MTDLDALLAKWEAERAEREKLWGDAWDDDDPMLPGLSDGDIEGIPDGYDDSKIDLVFSSYVDLRRRVAKLTQRLHDEGIISD